MEDLKYIKEIIVIFERFQLKFGGEAIPCSQQEIEQLELLLSPLYCLPAADKEFLFYGGKKMGRLFEGGFSFSWGTAKFHLERKNQHILDIVRLWDKSAEIPPDIFILTEHLGAYFEYFRLTEGDNPPVYTWNEENEGGMEVVQKEYESFSEYLKDQIRVCAIELMPQFTEEKLQAKTPPRGLQFWIPTGQEQVQGITLPELMYYLGLSTFKELDEAANMCGIESDRYLEELSGWNCYPNPKERIKTRFFPPNTRAN